MLNNSNTKQLKESQPHTPYFIAFLLLGPRSIYIPCSSSATLFPFMAFPLNATLQPSHLAPFFPGSSSTTVWGFFSVNSSDLLYMVHSTCLWTPSMHPYSSPPLPPLTSPPSIKPTPVQPHRPSKKDLGNRTELYFREMNLTTTCRAGWRQQASWEPSTKWENLNMERTGTGK